jgi:DNA-binding HxlR family transcriptional regulator
MPDKRAYRLLCPIARALDRVGDRWTLLILRDLHAGPARFTELQDGLTGLASNLLSSRLTLLQEDGLIHRQAGPRGARLYALTPDGEATASLLFELGNYGSRFPPAEDMRRPGNLRTIAVSLKELLRRSASPDTLLHVELVVDDEAFSVRVADGQASVRYGADPQAPVQIQMAYEPLIDMIDGHLAPQTFMTAHVQVTRGTQEQAGAYFGLLGRMG